MADLAQTETTYCPNDGTVVELVGIDGAEPLLNDDGSQMTITVLGADSDVAVKHRAGNTTKRIQQAGRGAVTGESLDSEEASYLAKLTVDWNIQIGNEKPPYTFGAAVKLYKNPRLAFIREQVDRAIVQRARFLKASPTS